MRAEHKVLRVVAESGPRKREVLNGLASHYGEGPYLIDYLIASGKLAKYGDRRGAIWGLPKRRVAR